MGKYSSDYDMNLLALMVQEYYEFNHVGIAKFLSTLANKTRNQEIEELAKTYAEKHDICYNCLLEVGTCDSCMSKLF